MSSIAHTNGSDTELRLRAQQLDIGYDGAVVVRDIGLELCGGQSLALVGTNGSGKSTLLKTIVGLLPPIGGAISVLGTQPGNAPKRLAYLSQSHAAGFVLPLRAIDVVYMGRFPARGLLGRMTSEDHDLVQAGLQTMEVTHLADKPLRSLSGGQQQRVYLAQVLARRADLLVLDEPTSGLDAAGRETYTQAMQAELARGAAVITATHDIREAGGCDLALLLAHRVIACGPAREVLTPAALLETFGVMLSISDTDEQFAILEREHRHE